MNFVSREFLLEPVLVWFVIYSKTRQRQIFEKRAEIQIQIFIVLLCLQKL